MIRPGSQKLLPTLGFLTVTCDQDQGLFGGYLILNLLGRPLEFHCTAPVRPNRAQAILYGPTLDPYLYGERIGHTLVDKGRASPRVVFTDSLPVMAARPLITTSMVFVCEAAPQTSATARKEPATEVALARSTEVALPRSDERPAAPRMSLPGLPLEQFALGTYRLGVLAEHSDDRTTVAEYWPQFADQIALEEPFGRIREAIEEARGVSS